MQTAQALAGHAVEQLVIDGRAFLTHTADETDFFHLNVLSCCRLVPASYRLTTYLEPDSISRMQCEFKLWLARPKGQHRDSLI